MSESKLSSVLPNNSIKGSLPRKPISTVYVENSNNTSSLEDVSYVNDIVKGFSSTAFSSTNMFKFSRTHQLLSQIVIELKLAGTAVPKSDYIAYSAIKHIRYSIGGTEPLTLKNPQLLNLVLEQCETQAKKEALLDISGRRNFLSDGSTNTVDLCTQDVQTNVSLVTEQTFYAILPLPWSSLSCENPIKPFPLHFLNEPLELEVAFKSADEFCGGVTSFVTANMHFRYAKFGNPEMMKKSVYRWPFNNHFMVNKPIPAGSTSLDLTGFRKGELTQILLHCVCNGFTKSTDAGLTDKRYFDGQPLNNLKLTFNGQTIWSAPNKEMAMWQLIDGKSYEGRHNKRRLIIHGTSSASKNEVVQGAGNDTSSALMSTYVVYGDSTDLQSNKVNEGASHNEILEGQHIYYRIPISEIIAERQKQGHFIGADFSKQSLTLTYDPPQAYDNAKLKRVKVDKSAEIFLTYTYRSMYQFDNSEVLLVM